MNELDQFIKHQIRVKYYFRYADDFIILSASKDELTRLLSPERSDGGQVNQRATIERFLKQELSLSLHPDKVFIRKFEQGIDFLGYVILPHHIVLRNKTKKRMFRKIAIAQNKFKTGELSQESFVQTIQSYFGMLQHCNAYNLQQDLLDLICDREYFERTGLNVLFRV